MYIKPTLLLLIMQFSFGCFGIRLEFKTSVLLVIQSLILTPKMSPEILIVVTVWYYYVYISKKDTGYSKVNHNMCSAFHIRPQWSFICEENNLKLNLRSIFHLKIYWKLYKTRFSKWFGKSSQLYYSIFLLIPKYKNLNWQNDCFTKIFNKFDISNRFFLQNKDTCYLT